MNTTNGNPGPTGAGRGNAALTVIASATLMALAAMSTVISGCGPKAPAFDPERHRKEIEDWRAYRLERLERPTGWLTLAGLGWLHEGENTVGSDSSNTVVTPPGKAPALLGTILLEGDSMRFRAARGVEVMHEGAPVTEIAFLPDDAEEPTELWHGSLLIYGIRRGDRLGVRLKDTLSAERVNFRGLEYFPIDPKYRLAAKFYPYEPPRILEIPTQAGTIQKDLCPGALGFNLDGREYRLDAVIEKGAEDELFIMFSDATSGKETYGPGRQMYTALPDSEGNVVLDFNRAFNWPCVFTIFATCPIPPRQNALPVRIEAGEKMYHGAGH
jgi:uncharacterized protein (DUF1684 family)